MKTIMDTYKLKFTRLQNEIFRLFCINAGKILNKREISLILKVSPTAVANSIVSEIRFKRQWHKDNEGTTTSDMIIRYLGWVEMEKHRTETTNGQR